MGCSDLRLVNLANHLADEAKWLVHGPMKFLNKQNFYYFDEAIADLDFIIGTDRQKKSANMIIIHQSRHGSRLKRKRIVSRK